MYRLYGILPWGLLALGLLHMAATWRYFDHLTQSALWFFNGGLVMIFIAVLNWVNRAHGSDAKSLRVFTRCANAVLLAFAITTGVVGRASVAELLVVMGLLGTLTALSLQRSLPVTRRTRSNEELKPTASPSSLVE